MSVSTLCPQCGQSIGTTGSCPRCIPLAVPVTEVATVPVMARPSQVTPTVSGPARPMTATAPPAIAGYEILGILGRGGMGVVYKARQVALKRIVALKMILSGSHAGEQELARFRAEAESVARLQHPHIVQVFEIGEADGHPFCTLEFVAGGSLAQQTAGTPQAPRRAAELVETLSRAMHHAHQHGIVHRDLKPANVLLAEDGTPKITDFGLAKQTDNPSGQTRSGAILGTPSYMAPEQAQGQTQRIGPATDVYALGAMLYELLTGRPPFKGETTVDTMLQVVTDEPVPPHRLQPKLPLDLDTICLKCLQKEPTRRYASAGDLADDLARFLRGEPILARPIGRAARLWRWCRREPKAAAVLLLFGLTVAAAFVLTVRSRSQAVEQADAQKSQREEAERLRQEADRLAGVERKQRRAVQHKFARLALDEAYQRCIHEDAARGLLALADSLPQAIAAENPELESRVRTQLTAWDRQLCPLTDVFPSGLEPRLRAQQVLFRPDGQSVLLACSRDASALLWDVTARKDLVNFASPGQYIYHSAFGADRKTVALGFYRKGAPLLEAQSGKVQVYDTATKQARSPVCQLPEVLECLALRPDGRALLTAGAGSMIVRVLDTATGKPLGPDLTHARVVTALTFYPDERVVLTGCSDGGVHFWELASGKEMKAFPFQHGEWVTALAASANKELMASAGMDGKVRIWSVFGMHPIGPPLHHPQQISAMAFRPDSRSLVTVCTDGLVRVWDIKPHWPKPALPERDQDVQSVDVTADGRWAVSTTKDAVIRIRDVRSGNELGPPIRCPSLVNQLCVSRDGRMLLTVSTDRLARLWDGKTGRTLGAPLSDPEGIFYAALSPDGTTAATLTHRDKRIQFWDVRTATKRGSITSLALFTDALLVFSPDGRRLLIAASNQPAQTWDVAARTPVGQPLQHLSRVRAAAFSADGKTLLTGSDDNTARLWDVQTGKAISVPLPHPKAVSAGAFSPNGQLVGTVCDDRVCMWDVKTGQALGAPLWQNDMHMNSAAFTPDGKALLASGGQVWSWPLPQPLRGTPERILLWAQVNIGLETDELGGLRALSREEWLARRQRLQALGGPPVP